MTFTTLQYAGVEKPLADWGISTARREVTNQCHDHFACDMMLPADSADPIPYGSQIILRIGRTAAGSTNAAGLPVSGITAWTGGTTWFIGYRVETFRTGSPTVEKLDFKFAGPWEFFFERLVFQKIWPQYDGTKQVADYRSQVILGQSVAGLNSGSNPYGSGDTIPGTTTTNMMSIAQQVKEIVAYVINQTIADYSAAQLQLSGLQADGNGLYHPAWDSAGNYKLLATPGTNCIIPDYIAGVYEETGLTSKTANLQTVLRAPLDSVNDITCAEAMRRMLKWIGPMGDAVIWFDYTTTPPTLNISTRDQLPAVNLPMTP